MPTFEGLMRVMHIETWSVEAKDLEEAKRKLSDLSEDVETDDTGGEVVDWEIQSVKPAR